MEKHRCERVVYKADGMRFPRPKQCKRDGVNFEDGKHWCTQHTPSVKKAKEDAAYRQRMEQYKQDNARQAHRNAALAACANIPNPAAIPGAVEVLKEVYAGKLAGERARAHASQALRDMGVDL